MKAEDDSSADVRQNSAQLVILHAEYSQLQKYVIKASFPVSVINYWFPKISFQMSCLKAASLLRHIAKTKCFQMASLKKKFYVLVKIEAVTVTSKLRLLGRIWSMACIFVYLNYGPDRGVFFVLYREYSVRVEMQIWRGDE